MRIRWYGTASVSIETENIAVLFDPYVPLRGSKVKTKLKDYAGFKTVVITHAHLDHIGSIPQLFAAEEREIYGTQAVHDALVKLGIPEKNIHVIKPDDELCFGDIKIKAYQGRHIKFDRKLLLKTIFSFRHIRYIFNLGKIFKTALICKEKQETLGYLIEAEGKTVFAMGSLNLDDQTEYPTDMDYLFLPYQGKSRLFEPAFDVIETLKPKNVLLHHYDDTFPPLSRLIDTSDIEDALQNKLSVSKMEYDYREL